MPKHKVQLHAEIISKPLVPGCW